MEQKKILTPSIANKVSFMFDESDFYYFVGSGGGGGGGYGITLKEDVKLSYKYILGILNSKLIDFYIKQISTNFTGGYYAYNKQYIEKIPIKNIDCNKGKSQHDKVVSIVDQMIQAQKECQSAKSDTDKNVWEKKIDLLDKQIDNLVYELYKLTPEEIKIVEESL